MGTFIHLVCIAVAGFAIVAQLAVAQGVNLTLPLTYPGRVLQEDGSQTCPSEAQREMLRNEITNAERRLLRESAISLLRYSCGRSTGWKRVAYLNMSDPSQQCPSTWQEVTSLVPRLSPLRREPGDEARRSPPHTGCVGEDSSVVVVAVRESTIPLVVSNMTRCVGGSSATRGELQTLLLMVLMCQSIHTISMVLV